MLKAVAGVRVRTYCCEVGLCLNIHSVAHVHRAAKDRKAVTGDIYIYSIDKQQICTLSGIFFNVNRGRFAWSVLCHLHSCNSHSLCSNNKPFFLFSQH